MRGGQQGSTLGVIAGRGRLPLGVAQAAAAQGRPVFILALHGQTDPATVESFPHAWVRLGDGSKSMTLLRNAGVEELVFAGGVTRPSLLALRPDLRAAKFLARVGFRALGDDNLLRAIVREFEAEGFRVVGAEEIWEDATMPAGQLGVIAPDAMAWEDIRRGVEVSVALAPADVGQSVTVQQGIVLTVEAIEGTAAMLQRAGCLRREGPGGVLIKIAKPAQDRRVDLPTIGLDTVKGAAAAGLRGIALEAGNGLLLDRERVIAAADAANIFVYGIDLSRFTSSKHDNAS